MNLPEDVAEMLLSLCSPDSALFCQFILDCSNIPAVISLAQAHHGSFNVHVAFFVVTRICHTQRSFEPSELLERLWMTVKIFIGRRLVQAHKFILDRPSNNFKAEVTSTCFNY